MSTDLSAFKQNKKGVLKKTPQNTPKQYKKFGRQPINPEKRLTEKITLRYSFSRLM